MSATKGKRVLGDSVQIPREEEKENKTKIEEEENNKDEGTPTPSEGTPSASDDEGTPTPSEGTPTASDDEEEPDQRIESEPEVKTINKFDYDPKFDREISAANLKIVVEEMAKDNGIQKEYEYIVEQTKKFKPSYKVSKAGHNEKKNRYPFSVFAPDHTRVVLQSVGDDPTSDYINANYISGLLPNTEKAYIATQSPLESTVHDFWRMIWHSGSELIIMILSNNEKNEIVYLPRVQQPLVIKGFKISLFAADHLVSADIIHKQLELYNEETGETRKIAHLHFNTWPDHGIPSSPDGLLELCKTVKTLAKKGPYVVHCSAGVGRTGVFCAVYSMIEKIEEDLHSGIEPKVNVVRAVLEVRKCRRLVERESQYKFIYDAMVQYIDKLAISEKGFKGRLYMSAPAKPTKKVKMVRRLTTGIAGLFRPKNPKTPKTRKDPSSSFG